MSALLAASRPTEWNLPLFVHVLGAMILVGGTLAGASGLAFARGEERLLRLGYWSLLAVGLPGFVVMRLGAAWIEDKEGWADPGVEEPAWLGIGYLVADLGGILFLLALALGGAGVYRQRAGGGGALLRIAMGISVLLLAAEVVAVWAMAAKPD